MTEVRVVAATGMLGSGFPASSLERAMAFQPHFIGCDAGSTDMGPYPLGSGLSFISRAATKRDLQLMIRAGRAAGIPVLVGSSGGAGGAPHLAWTKQIVEEIAREDRLHFRLATIQAEQDPSFVAGCFEQGRITPLQPAPTVSAESIRRFDRVVAVMGVEPYQAALDQGAEVVLAGRSTDTAIYSAIPLQRGVAPGLAWQAAKLLECGAASVEHRLRPDCLVAFLREDHIEVTPPNPELRCTPLSVAAHTLYENGDPFHLYEPGGMLDTTDTEYVQLPDGRSVKITGPRFVRAERYTVKLEAAELVGYQAFSIAGIRDSAILRDFDGFMESILPRTAARVKDLYGDSMVLGRDCQVRFVVYGRDGSMGPLEPIQRVEGHEIGVLLEATAQTQELANTVAGLAEYILLHNPVPHWKGFTANVAYPYSPSHFPRGPVYRFAMNHVLELEDPMEVFKLESTEL